MRYARPSSDIIFFEILDIPFLSERDEYSVSVRYLIAAQLITGFIPSWTGEWRILLSKQYFRNKLSNMGNQPTRIRNKNVLLIIDPQIDFMPGGSLGVPGADEDCKRTADMIIKHADEIDEILVTMDSHHRNHIAHAIFWEDAEGKNPPPNTLISHDDIGKTWWPRDRRHMEWCKEYTSRLTEGNRFMLCIWPEHCLIGTPGHAVAPVLNEALQYWTSHRLRNIGYLHKGMNNLTEMYSCIQAEVSVEIDRTTMKNTELMRKLLTCRRLIICGQASTHSVHFTAIDILHDCPSGHESRMVLLTDAMSPVEGCEDKEVEFLAYCKNKGVTLSTTDKVFSLPYCLDIHSEDGSLGSKDGFKPLVRNGSEKTDLTIDSKNTEATATGNSVNQGSRFSILNLSFFDSSMYGGGVLNSAVTSRPNSDYSGPTNRGPANIGPANSVEKEPSSVDSSFPAEPRMSLLSLGPSVHGPQGTSAVAAVSAVSAVSAVFAAPVEGAAGAASAAPSANATPAPSEKSSSWF